MTVGCVVGFGTGLWISICSYSIKNHLEVLPTPIQNCTTQDLVNNMTWATSTLTSSITHHDVYNTSTFLTQHVSDMYNSTTSYIGDTAER